jgi:hypothetical protein
MALSSMQEMSSYLPSAGGPGGQSILDRLSSSDLRRVAAARMKSEMSDLEREVSLCGCAVEAASLLVWRHLEHFLLFSAGVGGVFEMAYRRKAAGKIKYEIFCDAWEVKNNIFIPPFRSSVRL